MTIKSIVIVTYVLVLFACGSQKRKLNDSQKSEKVEHTTKLTTASGKKFVVHIDHSGSASICNILIEKVGFSASNTPHELKDIDPVEDIFLADLDKNGFEELYLLTRSAGSGSYQNIYGIASNHDKSTTPVYVRPITEEQLMQGNLFEGYRGHNKFSFENGELTNTFPVYREGDKNAKATGGTKTIGYRLVTGEAGWILEPFGSK